MNNTINKISEDTLREIAPQHIFAITNGNAFLFGSPADPMGAIALGNGEWALFRLVETQFAPDQVLVWWKWCEQTLCGYYNYLELNDFVYLEFAVVANVMVLSLDWQPITAEVTVMDVDGRRGQLTFHVSDWDAIDQSSEFARIQLAQMLEWEIFWEESA